MARKKKKIETEEVVEETATTEIDEAQISEEDLENSGLSELVARGKEQGFLTYEEINFMLPEDISTSRFPFLTTWHSVSYLAVMF